MLFLLFIPLVLSSQVIRKSVVSFPTEDGLLVTADRYFSIESNPYILLFHTEGSARAEFDSIAGRFIKMNYNCLSVDLRSGDRFGFVMNETARRAREQGLKTGYYESVEDMDAAIQYMKGISDKPMILLGSSSSASLAIIKAKDDPDINAVVAFSPGDFFLPEIDLKKVLGDYRKPVFAGFSAEEFNYFALGLEHIKSENLILFKPSYGTGTRTVEALFNTSEGSDEYWFGLLVFFRSLR